MIKIDQERFVGSVDLLKAIYTDSPIGIEIYDSKGKLIDLNQSCMELFGVSNKDDVKGFNLFNDPNIPNDHLTKLKRRETVRFESIFDFDLVKNHKLYNTTKSGKIYLNVLITPLFIGKNKSISNFLVQVQDNSDQKIAEHKLIEFNEDLEKRVQERTKQLRKSEEDWQILVEDAPDIIFTVDRNGRILYINKVPKGITKEEAIGTNVLDYVDPSYHETVKKSIAKVFRTGESDYYEISARGPDDNPSWYSTRLGAIKQDEEIVSVMLITRDITEYKKTGHALRESEEQYKNLNQELETVLDIIPGILFCKDRNGVVTRTNQGFAESLNLNKEDIIGKTAFDLFPKDQAEVFQRDDLEVINTGKPKLNIEESADFPNGTIWAITNKIPYYNKEGEINGIIGLSVDITERKKIEQELKESEEKFRTISDQSLVGIVIAQDGIIKYVNKQMETLSGYSMEEMKNWKAGEFLKIIHPEYKKLVAEQSRKKQMGLNGVIDQYQFKGIKKSGEHIWIDDYSKTITYERNPAVLSIMIDITEKKEAERNLKESEEKFRGITEQSLMGIQILQNNSVQYVNQRTADLFGYSVEEILNWPPGGFLRTIHPDDKEMVVDHARKRQAGLKDNINHYQYRAIKKDGDTIWLEVYAKQITYRGKPADLGTVIDITDKKLAEESVEYQAKLVENVSDAIISTDLDFKIITWNKAAESIYGWNEEEAIGENIRDIMPVEYPNDNEEDVIQQFFEEGSWKGEVIQYNRDGLPINMLSSVSLIEDITGKPIGAVAINRDITERKKAEERIRESEKRLKDLIEAVPAGISISTPEGKIIECNSTVLQYFGYNSKEKFLETPVIDLYRLPSDREKFVELLKSGLVKDFEAEFKRKDGSIFWGSLTSITQKVGDHITYISSFQDITDRKLAEIKIQQSEAELTAIYNYTPIALLLLDNERRIRKINKFALKFTDRQEEEVFGVHGGEALRCLYSIKDPRGCGFSENCKECVIRNTVLDTFKTQKPYINVEATLFLLPGSEVDKTNLLFSTIPLKFDGEDLVLISLIDISDRMNAEQKLKESEERYRNFIENFQGIAFQGYRDFSAAFFHGDVQGITGYIEEDFISGRLTWNNLIHPDDLRKVNEEVRIFHESSATTDKREYRISNIGHDTRWVIEYNQKFFDPYLKKEGVRGIIIDNTKYKTAENKLKESGEKFRMLFNNAPFAIVLFNIGGYILDCNKATTLITGYKKEELIGNNFKDFNFYVDNEASNLEERQDQTETGKTPKDREILLHRKDGSRFWARSQLEFIHLGKETYLQAILQDITDQKIAQIKLKESEEKFRTLFNFAADSICIHDLEGHFLEVNQTMVKKLGYTKEEILKMTPMDIDTPEYSQFVIERIGKLIEDRSSFFETEQVTKEGKVIPTELSSTIIEYKNNTAVLSIARDISERKASEKRYKHLAKELEVILDHIPGIVVYKDIENKILRVNKFMADAHNLKKEDMEGKSSFNFYPKEEAQAYWEDDLEVVESKKPKLNIVEPWETLDGRKWVNTSKIPYIDEYGNVNGIIAVAFDITDRVTAEQGLKKSEENYRDLSNQYKMLLESITDAVYVLNRDWEYIIVNKNAEKVVNMPVEDLMGKKIFDLFPGIEGTAFFQTYENVMENRIAKRVTEPFTLPNGRIGYYEVSVYPINEGILCIAKDITEEKEIEQRLKESQEKFRTIAEQSSIGVIIQQEGIIQFSNKAVSEILEYSLEEINNQAVENLYKIVHKDDLPLLIEKFEGKQSDGKESVDQFELRIFSKLGTVKWISIFNKPIIYLGEKATLSTLIDISDKKRVEEELREVSRLKSDLLSRTSHELKTPLVSIKGYADLLLSQHYDGLDFYTISVLHEIKQGCYRLESLIKDLLETSKLESEEIELNKTEEDLTFLIRFCIKDLQGLIETRKHKLLFEIQDNLVTRFEKEKIYEVIINLLSNSIKYTPSNGTIKINSEIRDNQYMISVKDNGIGLTEEEISKIFKKFGKIERYGKGLDVVSEGSGLGLYISKKIIELHGGNIWVESEGRNKGSTFYFSLPIIKD